MVIEFHGADHRGAVRQTADVRKEAALRGVGLEVTGVTGIDLGDEDGICRRLIEARSRALFQPERDRRWIARPPADDLHQRLVTQRALRDQHEWVQSQPLPEISERRGW